MRGTYEQVLFVHFLEVEQNHEYTDTLVVSYALSYSIATYSIFVYVDEYENVMKSIITLQEGLSKCIPRERKNVQMPLSPKTMFLIESLSSHYNEYKEIYLRSSSNTGHKLIHILKKDNIWNKSISNQI